MLGSADRDALCSLSILLGNHRNALSCAVKPLSLLLPERYAPCMVPTVPSPKELLSSNWCRSRPREYVKLLEGLVSSWRIFEKKREVHLHSDPPSPPYAESVNNETETSADQAGLDDGNLHSPPNSPSTSGSLLSPSSSSTNATVTASANITPLTSPRMSKGSTDSTENSSETSSRIKRYRKARAYFQPHHLSALESFYRHQSYLSTYDREMLSKKLGLSEDRIRTWFQNRRMKEKRKPRSQHHPSATALNLSMNQ